MLDPCQPVRSPIRVTMRADDVHRFLNASAAGNDVFGDDKPLVRPDLKAAPQGKPSGFFFDEDMPFAEGAPHFVADHHAAERRRQDDGRLQLARPRAERPSERFGVIGVLKDERALQVAGAVQSGRQQKMTSEQSACLFENASNVY